jgi:hypothetical protein
MEGTLRKILIACAATAALLAAGAASAAPSITNGNFDGATPLASGQLGFNTSVPGWSTTPGTYDFVFAADGPASGSVADKAGAVGQFGPVILWGPGNGQSNNFTADNLPGGGGAFVASDPAFNNGAISQVVTGLTKGVTYQISFDWAGAQQMGFTGATTEGWNVTFGSGPTQHTGTDNTPSMGFSPWQNQTFNFVADGTSDTLSFLSFGGPSSTQPPFALLDNVSITPVPEPATWALMLVGVGALGAGLRMRRREVFATA